jgi:voltage-gated potassium channel
MPTKNTSQNPQYNQGNPLSVWREALNQVIFGTETKAGKAFDVVLMGMILLSIGVVMLDSIEDINPQYAVYLYWAEWVFTAIFTLEYVLRLVCVRKPWLYARSF